MSTTLSPTKMLMHNDCAASPRHARRCLFANGRVAWVFAPAPGQQATAYKPAAAAASSNVSTCSNDSAPSSSTINSGQAIAAVMAASMAVTAAAAAAPTAAIASESTVAPGVELQLSSAGPLRSSSVAELPLPEAPALVSDSSEMLLGNMREAVAGSLQEMAASSMTAVGGPVVGEALSAGLANSSSSSSSSSDSLDSTTSSSSGIGNTSSPATGAAAASIFATAAANMEQVSAAASPAALELTTGMSFGHRALLCGLWQGYCNALERSPLLTKVYTGVAGTMLGDLAAQLLSYNQASTGAKPTATTSSSSRCSSQRNSRSSSTSSKPGFKYDALRCGRLCLYSAAIGTPMGHYWYEVLEALVMPASPTAPAAVAAKVALDQLLQTPFGMALFFAVMKVMEGKPREVPQELRAKLVPGLLANWKLWPAAQLVNFTVIPPEQRILFGNIVGVCWTCVISNMQQSSSSANEGAGAGGSSKAGIGAGGDAAASNAAEADAADARKLRRTSTPMPAAGRLGWGVPAECMNEQLLSTGRE